MGCLGFALEIICSAVPHLVLLRSGEGESKPGLRAGGEEKGRGVVARQVSGEQVFERSLAMRNMMLMVNVADDVEHVANDGEHDVDGEEHDVDDEEHVADDEKHVVDDKVDSALTLLECRMQKLDNVLGTNYGSFWIITKVGQVRITL